MTLAMISLALFCCNSFVLAESGDIKKKLETGTMDDKISYAIGYDISENLKENFKINPDLFYQGIKDNLEGKPNMSDDEIKATLKEFQSLVRKKQMEGLSEKAAVNKVKGEAFLAKNKVKQGVITLESGLQYKIIKEGKGDSPKEADKVKCHYRGTLVDGKEFDSSYKRNQPAVFPVNGVIKGWTEALQLMKPGSKWMLWIPSDLGYGDRGAGQMIEPGSTLIFEVELLSIEK
ncbi:MAG: FKBP-type peptidyl-prolyl cis-trans isomerase [Desulfobacteraceae bacterium]|nr:MAG: FKBP-type peptidyl-prolyl cis-trans isomerase [Desulfobacteraceae bacterium]